MASNEQFQQGSKMAYAKAQEGMEHSRQAMKEAMVSKPHKLAAEFLGTFCLCFTIALVSYNAGHAPPGTSVSMNIFAVGSLLTVMVYALGNVSGANLNPAVSVALHVQGRLDLNDMTVYIIAQVAGGLASAILSGFIFEFEVTKVVVLGGNGFFLLQILAVEFLYTTMLCFVVLNVAGRQPGSPSNKFYGLAIGFTVVAGGLSGGGISGGCFNPAVAVALDFSSISNGIPFACLLYVAVELAGACLAVTLFHIVRPEEKHDPSGVSEYSPSRIAHKLEGMCPKELSAEFIGTYFLVLTVGLSVLSTDPVNTANAAASGGKVSLAIGAALASMIYAVGDVSGGHFNPAVTLAVMLTGANLTETRHDKKSAGLWVCAQVAGAVAGAFSYFAIWVDFDGPHKSMIEIAPKAAGPIVAIAGEAFATFVLCYVVLCVATVKDDLQDFKGLAIGACIWSAGEAVGPLSGGSLNPAVTVGLTVSSFSYLELNWVYWLLAEFAGAGLAAGAFMKGTHQRERMVHAREALMADGSDDSKLGYLLQA